MSFEGGFSADLRGELEAMNQCLQHRGPDDRGIYVDGPVGLAQTRLSIIDLSPTGHQPMGNEDGTIWIVFNGEIYNFQVLREELERSGHRFVGTSDTQVIIHGYEEWGIEGCLQRLRGMFAFAIWDGRKRLLILARDRLGKKPLKYYVDQHKIIFASELKAILTDRSIATSVDYDAIDFYLTHQYVPTPYTGFKEIRKLPAAHYLTCSEKGQMQIHEYWDLRYKPDHGKSPEEWHHLILQHLDEAVRLRMLADVPVGAFLSGGVDSSAVVSSMARQSAQPIRTFSVGFSDQQFDELPFARMVAKQYGTDHTELILEPDEMDMLPKLVYHFEEPYADSSALATYLISEATRRYVTVALNGDGGDEAFAGYSKYIWLQRSRPYDVLRPLMQLASFPAQLIYDRFPTDRSRRNAIFLESYRHPRRGRFTYWQAYFSSMEKSWLYHPQFVQHRKESPVWNFVRSAAADEVIDQALYIDAKTYLPDDLLVKVDIASMAASLEARSPLLDQCLVEFAATIPVNLKVKGSEGKAIFKEALLSRLPREVMYRKKRGFSIPVDRWFRESRAEWAREILLDPRSLKRNLFRAEGLERLLREHQTGKVRHGNRIWALIVLELWFRQFTDVHATVA